MYLYRPMQIVLIAVSAFLFSQIAASEAANGVEPTGVNTLQGQPRLTIGHNEIGVAVDVVKLNPDGTRILTVSENNVAKIWSTKSGDLLRTINLGHVFKQVDSNGLPCVPASDKDPWCTATIASANYSPDGKKLVTNEFWDPTARVWDVDTGKLLNSFAHGPDEEV